MSLEIGQVVGDYQVIGVIGAGGMGSVYKAKNLISDRVDAMKVLLADLRSSPDLADRFLHEIKVLASLAHPNIAALHTALRVDNQLLMIMEMVDGTNLEERLAAGEVTAADGIRYIAQVLSALAYAHSRGVVHRDIKPANIAINSEGSVKLLDFGLARGTTDRRMTRTGMVLGSLFYMSPEQVAGKQADARSDIYSTGITLYRVLTGRRPIDGDSEFAVMRAQVQEVPLPPYHWNSSVPIPLSDAIMRALAKSPDARFQTASEFRRELEPFLRPAPPPRADTTRTMVSQVPRSSSEPVSPTPLPSSSLFHSSALQVLVKLLALSQGPIASALVKKHARSATSLPELCDTLARQIPSESDRRAFLNACGGEFGSHLDAGTVQTPSEVRQVSAPSGTSWDPAVLDRCRKLLAPHVGPLAKIIVDRASKKTGSLDELYLLVSAEIPSKPDRERFLKSREKAAD